MYSDCEVLANGIVELDDTLIKAKVAKRETHKAVEEMFRISCPACGAPLEFISGSKTRSKCLNCRFNDDCC
jgi:uncharacterized protein (DUF983 family)